MIVVTYQALNGKVLFSIRAERNFVHALHAASNRSTLSDEGKTNILV